MPKSYDELSEASKERYKSALDKARRSGLTINELLELDDTNFRKVYDTTAKDLNPQRRVLKNLKLDKERKNDIVKDLEKEYKTLPDAIQSRLKKGINKTIGNTFNAITDQLKEKKDYSTEGNQKLYSDARELLKVPKSLIDQLDPIDQEIIQDYDTSP